MNRISTWLLVTLLSLFAWSSPTFAVEPQAGRDFKVINPPLETPNGKIEVIEFFSYACPHCNDFHPIIGYWAAGLPKDVSFRRVPVSFNRAEWARLARIYFTLELTGDLAKLDGAVFDALHKERISFKTDDAVVAWATSKGADAKKFADTMASFSMQSRVVRADKESTAAQITGVPAIVVDGKYLLNNEAVTNFSDLLKLTDSVIAKARQERKGK